jgi:hypothetical protein
MPLSCLAGEVSCVRRWIFFCALALVAFAVVANVGFRLVGALGQIDVLAGTDAGAAASSEGVAVPRPTAPVAAARVVESTATTADALVPESGPAPRFDTEAALRDAGDLDSNVAELLNDPDPAVGNAVRDFITSLVPPGGN